MATKVQALKDVNGNKLYPKTSADAVAYDTTSSVKSKLANGVYCERVKNVSGDNFPINATTLNGYTSDNFVKVSDLETLQDGSAMTIDDGQGNDVTLQQYIDDSIRAHNISNDSHANLFNAKTFYVDASKGDDDYSGTSSQPFKTIQHAINNIPNASPNVAILVSPGTYDETPYIRYKLGNVWIGRNGDSGDIILNNGIVIYTCHQIVITDITFTKAIRDSIIAPTDPNCCCIWSYHSNTDVRKCKFITTQIPDNNDITAISINNGDSTINNCDMNGFTYPIAGINATLKCTTITGSNNQHLFYSHTSTIIYDETCTITYNESKCDTREINLILDKSAAQYLNMFSNANSNNAASFHNSIYRGKDITNYLNDGTLFTRISNGTFDDLFIGDYFYLNDLAVDGYTVITKKMVLCGFDTYLGTGDKELTRHHAVVMPSGRLFTATMNDTDTTEGGYYNSKMHQEIMPKITTGLINIISNHLITYRDLLTTATNNGASSNWTWNDTTCRICSEVDIYAYSVWGNGYDIGLSNRQLPIFRLYSRFYQGEDRYWMWLSTIAGAAGFSICGGDGGSGTCHVASNSGGGVRPRFLIG